jgi:uncharacterized OB-fold protein
MTAQQEQKPIPVPDAASAPYFDGAKQGKLMMQRCKDCGAWHHPVRTYCDDCLSPNLAWQQASGKGEVYNFALMHYVYHPAFASEVPYNLTVVKLAEGPVVETNLIECKNSEIKIGLPVEAVFVKLSPEVTVPKFRLVRK